MCFCDYQTCLIFNGALKLNLILHGHSVLEVLKTALISTNSRVLAGICFISLFKKIDEVESEKSMDMIWSFT